MLLLFLCRLNSKAQHSVFPFTLLRCLVGFVQNLHEVFGHEVWLLEGSVISLQVLHCETGTCHM